MEPNKKKFLSILFISSVEGESLYKEWKSFQENAQIYKKLKHILSQAGI
jgi:hypothetical protein